VWPRLLTGNSSLTPCSTARIIACRNVTSRPLRTPGSVSRRSELRGVQDDRSSRRLIDAPMLVAYTIGADFPAARTETYDVALPAGQPLDLELELRGDPRPPLQLTGEVRWCANDATAGKYRIGVEFTGRTAEQEAQLVGYIDTMYKLRDLGVL